jgi:hypothetical protein
MTYKTETAEQDPDPKPTSLIFIFGSLAGSSVTKLIG